MGSTGEVLQQVKDTYANAVIVDDVNGFDNVLVDTFVSRIEKFGLAKEDLDLQTDIRKWPHLQGHLKGDTQTQTNTFAYLHLYDSLKLYALAVRKVINKTDEANQTAAVLDGHQIWSAMRRLSFDGIGTVVSGSNTGLVQMDDLADRAPQFAAFFIAPNREKVLKMVQMATYRIPNCDGTINRTGCYDLKLTDVMTGFWPSENGAMPPDEPVCGFRGQRCSYTVEIAVGATVLALIMLILLLWLLRRHCQTRALNKMPWRLFSDDFRLIDEEAARSLLSIGSSNTKLSNQSIGGSKKHAILGVNTHATYRRFIQKQPLKFNREDMVLLTAVKDAIHDNINPFLGMAFNDKEEMFILWKFCSRGSVQDIIYNKSMTLDEKFHAAFVRDITLGLEYLHLSKVGFHGLLSPSTCVIDRNWSVRLTDFGLATMLERWQKEGQIQPYKAEEEEEVVKEKRRGSKEKSCPTAFDRRGLKANYNIYCPPEMLKNREQNRRRRMDQSWIQQTVMRRQAGDIYAFGIVMYEILFRDLPFPRNVDLSGVGASGDDGSRHIKPTIQEKETQIHPDMAALLIDCWSENAEIRPSIRRVRLNTESVLKWLVFF
uniref:guanylate cyclase n=1 Tax=Meloidogyne incognita TaxID=6306 RepID=A0A914M209_MELIC